MTKDQAIEWMQRNFFCNKSGGTEFNVMERFSMDQFPWSSITQTGNVSNNVTFTTAQLDQYGVKHVSYSFQVKMRNSASTYSEQTINLIGNGSGWNFNVQNAGSSTTLANGLTWNRSTTKTDGYNLLTTIEFIKNHDLDGDMLDTNHGYGAIHCGHRAIPSEVMDALDFSFSTTRAKVCLVKRKGHVKQGKNYPQRDTSAQAKINIAFYSNSIGYADDDGADEQNFLDALGDAVDNTDLKVSQYFDKNHNYQNTALYVSEDADSISVKTNGNPTFSYSYLNSSQQLPGYQGSPSVIFPIPGKNMSLVHGAGIQGGGQYPNQDGKHQGTLSTPCCSNICGLDFYGAGYDIASITDGYAPGSSPTKPIYGGNGVLTSPGSDYGDGDRNQYFTGAQQFQDEGICQHNINLQQDDFTDVMLCAIKSMAAYEFSKECYCAGDGTVMGNKNPGDSSYFIRKPSDAHPAFERYYYTVAVLFYTPNTPNHVLAAGFPDSVRWIDKDDMPRNGNTGQINGHGTNMLGLKHLYNYSNQLVLGSLTGGSYRSVTCSGKTINFGYNSSDGGDYEVSATLSTTYAPGYSRFKIPFNGTLNGQSWGKIVANYQDGTQVYYDYPGGGNPNIPAVYNGESLTSCYLFLMPGGFID